MNRSSLMWFLLLLVCAPGGAAAAEVYFTPGEEAAVVDLLIPYTDADLRLEGWDLEGIDVGPTCELRFHLREAAGAGEAMVRVLPADSGDGSFRFDWGAAAPPRPLASAFEELLRGNDPGSFFQDRCNEGVDVAAPGVSKSGFPWFVVLRLSLVALLAGLGLAVLGRGRRSAGPAGPGPLAEPRWVLAVFVVGLVLRGVAAVFAPSYSSELEFVSPDFERFLWFVRTEAPFLMEDGFLSATRTFHTPLLRMILYPWHFLGDALGVGGTLLWMRVPTLGLAAWMMALLLRAGRHLDQPGVGRAAMALFAILPWGVYSSIMVGHYLLEMVLTAWFLERLLAAVCGKREVWRQVAVAAGAAAWAGYVTWPLVALGVIAGMVHLARRGRRRDLLALALAAAALATPLIGSALDSVTAYDAACVPLDELSERVETVPVYEGHPVFDVSERSAVGVVRVPWLLALQLHHPAVAVFAVAGFLLLLLRRPGGALLPALIFLFYGYARTRMQLSMDNLRLLTPLMLFLPVWGFRLAPALRLPRFEGVLDGRRLVLIFSVFALLVGAGQRLERGEQLPDLFRGSFYQGMVRWMAGDNLSAIRAALGPHGDQSLPVVMPPGTALLHAGICHGFSSHAELLSCLEVPVDEGPPNDIKGPDGSAREFFLLPDFSCEGLVQLLTAPVWRAERFFVLLSVDLAPHDWPACFAAEWGACEVVAETPMLWLWRCNLDGRDSV